MARERVKELRRRRHRRKKRLKEKRKAGRLEKARKR